MLPMEPIRPEVVIEREDAAQAALLAEGHQRRVSKIQGQVGVLAHELGGAVQPADVKAGNLHISRR